MSPAQHYVGVIGSGKRCTAPLWRLAHATGAALAQLHPHVVLVNGGLSGTMDGTARGMTEGGGVAIGLIPAGHEPNRHLTYAIRLGLPLLYRDIATAMASDVVLVLPGHTGTSIEGWAASERGLPLVRVGDHGDWPSAALPFTAAAEPGELVALVADLLGLQGVRRDADQGRDLVP